MLHGGRHAIRGITALFTLVALLLAPAGLAAAAEPTYLQASAELNGNGSRVSVRGTLTTADEPVDDARIHVRFGQASLGTTGTNRRGEFQLNAPIPVGTGGGSHVITVSFDGDDDLDPSSATITVELPGGQDPDPDDGDPAPPEPPATVDPTPTTPPPDTRPNAGITLNVDPVDPRPGDLLTLSGRVTAGEAAVASVAVEFTLGGWESTDSLTYTADDGTWSTFMEVPADQAPGSAELRASVGEGSAHKAGSRAVTLTIQEPVEATEEPEPTEDAEPTPEATPEATATPTVVETDDASADTGETGDAGNIAVAPGPWSWFLIAVVAVGGTALLVTIALLMRRALHPGEGADASDTVFLLGSEDWDEEWHHTHPDTGLEEPTQEIQLHEPGLGDEPGPGEPPAEDPGPRRGLPAGD